MSYEIKRKGKRVKAYELGTNSEMEKQLIQEGTIQRDNDGYLLFSREVVNGVGEKAKAGDFFKVEDIDGRHYAYPNAREWFLAQHRHIEGDEYEQVSKPLHVWLAGDPLDNEISYLLTEKKLQITTENKEQYFHAFLWGAPLSAAIDATIVFYSVNRDANGKIEDVDFGLVERVAFENSYVFCDAQGHPIIHDQDSSQ